MKFSRLLFGVIGSCLAMSPSLLAATPGADDRARAEQAMLNLPLRFEENAGRFDPSVKYLARGPGYTLFLTPGESVLTLESRNRPRTKPGEGKGTKESKGKASVVRVRLQGGNASADLRGEDAFRAPVNYLLGNDPAKWRTGSNYQRIRAESVYPGVDLVYYGKQGGLEYDFEVAPGAEPNQIRLRYDGVRRLQVNPDEMLVSRLKGGGELRQKRPTTYQMIAGERREVASRYVLKGKNVVAFEVGEYDPAEALVIDPPVISYSTYIGGALVDDAFGIAVDGKGLIYVTGNTASSDFPTLNQYQTDLPLNDVFVLKIDPLQTGTASLLYSTYLGGNFQDFGRAIAVDDGGNAFVTGDTESTDFPTLNQYQLDQPFEDAFVTKLDTNATGAASLVYSTYLGGGSFDYGTGIAIGGGGNALVTGKTDSSNFPIFNEYQTNRSSTDAFVTKLDPSASGAASLLFSTYLGGDDVDAATAIAVTAGGIAFVTGDTLSTDFPTLNQYQTDQGGTDVFVSKIDTGASGAAALLYSTYLGGNNIDRGYAIAIDSGHAYVTGQTVSPNFPVLNQYQSDQPGSDAFVTRLNTNAIGAGSLIYSTYLGGADFDVGYGIGINPGGTAFVTGYTISTDFPTVDPLQTDQPGDDAFVSRLNTNATGAPSLVFSTYLAGDGEDEGRAIAIFSGDIYVAGKTESTDFPTLNGYQSDQGFADAFVTRYAVGLELTSAVSRKTHGATVYDIILPRSGAVGIECRSGGVDASHTLVFTFNRDVVSGSAAITTGTGSTAPPVFSGATMSVPVENVTDVQTMLLTLTNVTSVAGGVLPSVQVQLKFLIGDTNGNSSVNASDVGQTKASSGLPITDLNFRTDTNVSGTITASDIGQVKANAGHTL